MLTIIIFLILLAFIYKWASTISGKEWGYFLLLGWLFLSFFYIFIYSLRIFHWSLSDRKSAQVSPTLINILADYNNAVVWMVSTLPPTSKTSSPFNNTLVTALKAPTRIGTIVTFMFHIFFISLARSRDLSFFSHSFSFILWPAGTAKSTILQILFFLLLIIIRCGLLAETTWSVCMSKSHRSLCVSFSRIAAGVCITICSYGQI